MIPRQERVRLAAQIAEAQDGLVHRAQLRDVGITRDAVRAEERSGRWACIDKHTVSVTGAPIDVEEPLRAERTAGKTVILGSRRLFHAVWESGSGAALDGAAALIAAGMTGFTIGVVDVCVPRNNRRHQPTGVRVHRSTVTMPVEQRVLPRVRLEHACLNAARWALSDRQAALLLCLPVQQRLVLPDRLVTAWTVTPRRGRWRVIDRLLPDVCDGAHSLGELDMARLCRRAGLPEPTRQAVRMTPRGRVYLDAEWQALGLVVEVDGIHHGLPLNTVDDALRQNEVVLAGRRVLRVPVVGLRTDPEAFIEQLRRCMRSIEGAA